MHRAQSHNEKAGGRLVERESLISLFAGAGGLDIGLERAGFETLVANELTDYGSSTLRANKSLAGMSDQEFDLWFKEQAKQKCYRNSTESEMESLRLRISTSRELRTELRRAAVLEGDIRDLTSDEIMRVAAKRKGEVTLVAGGPPCQPFSRAGKRENVEVADGRLFLEFVRVVKDLNPRWFVFENVKGLLMTKTAVVKGTCNVCGRTSLPSFDERASFISGGIDTFNCPCGAGMANAYEENVPGGSLEIILSEFQRLGYLCRWKVLNSADFGVPQTRERLFIVGSRDAEDFEWPTPTHTSVVVPLQKQLSFSDDESPTDPWIGVGTSLWETELASGELDPSVARLWVKNVVRPHDEPVTWSLDRPSPTIGAHQAAKLALAPLGVPEAQLSRQQWHTKGHRQGDTPPVPVEHRYLTDLELLTLQSFPPYWYLSGTRMERAFQIGNAVPVKLAEAVGGQILKACRVALGKGRA
jgi:DNA (cytosine-5)-methyltransferase 1